MLKNELQILTTILARQGKKAAVDNKWSSDFSKVATESCNRAREAWSIAAFSDINKDALSRYFDFHFSFLNGLISEKFLNAFPDGPKVLNELMDHLLRFYTGFIDQDQWVALEYLQYRIRLLEPAYREFCQQLLLSNVDEDFKLCLRESLGPIYQSPDAGPMTLEALYYREELMLELSGKGKNLALMTDEILVATLMAFNFNHARFFGYLRKRCLKGISNLRPKDHAEHFAELIAGVPVTHVACSRCFDTKWPPIGALYRDWLNDYQALLRLSAPAGSDTSKIPLNISVKQLACMIRALYQSGFYGAVKLTAIFDHAAAVFSTKRQEQISAESISNAYYALEQSSALKVVRMLGSAVDFLKPYCFPA
ncbi:hypothetical protein [Mucilaginibacter rubeus]|uniref:Uncharacterized protein n=1 Tax=Mucilaginibacter rubeus TaxID=2027860 RepID=A0A5C1HTL4_9SPHI|nr:hypothetical protein [Mucilaginibacter rubeus]QEM09144.1 hypothetical protein DEO27_003630 [Mucilaginibacter rubeus]